MLAAIMWTLLIMLVKLTFVSLTTANRYIDSVFSWSYQYIKSD